MRDQNKIKPQLPKPKTRYNSDDNHGKKIYKKKIELNWKSISKDYLKAKNM